MPLQKRSTVAGTGVSVRTSATAGEVGFRDLVESDVFVPRLIICSSAHQKRGKTHFGLTMPEPISVFSFHNGLEGIDRNVVRGRDIKLSKYEWDRPTKSDPSERVQASSKRIIERFETELEWAIANTRSLLFDDATDLWALLRLANFGKLNSSQLAYADLNAQMVQWIRSVQSSTCNLVMAHKVKEEWTNVKTDKGTKGQTTGQWIRDGYRGAEFDAHVCIVHDRDYKPEQRDSKIMDGKFFFTVYDCRQNADLVGQMFIQDSVPGCSFMDLAQMCYPETNEEDWR